MKLMRHNIKAVCEKFSLQLKCRFKKNTLNSSQNYRYRPTALNPLKNFKAVCYSIEQRTTTLVVCF